MISCGFELCQECPEEETPQEGLLKIKQMGGNPAKEPWPQPQDSSTWLII